MKISYECEELIKELKQDIAEFGGNEKVIVWCKNIDGNIIYTNYDFKDTELSISKEELNEDEYFDEITMNELLEKLINQNEIL